MGNEPQENKIEKIKRTLNPHRNFCIPRENYSIQLYDGRFPETKSNYYFRYFTKHCILWMNPVNTLKTVIHIQHRNSGFHLRIHLNKILWKNTKEDILEKYGLAQSDFDFRRYYKADMTYYDPPTPLDWFNASKYPKQALCVAYREDRIHNTTYLRVDSVSNTAFWMKIKYKKLN